MRLVLLPGLNGSSALFAPLLETLAGIDCWPLSLPEQGPQDYPSLADALMEQLGTTPFALLGESFSGPLAYQLALRQPTGLRGVIFAASFLSRPNPALTLLAHLPIPNALATQPWLLRTLCLDKTADAHMLQRVQREIRRLDPRLLRTRLATLASLQAPTQTLDLPCLHLWPQQDRLVADSTAERLSKACTDIRQIRLDGPHFILQTRPQACANAIVEFIQG
ncbi:alpha/beta fold hydrolase [Ectopseudomonas guguanensis]|jgi:pimeloyl-ACP methyl ester carboxylesterase|uniref:Pimeloyl-ACP methyl ester carboxylesterase n=1 Tax=Ectopseudomonas guguanensis TaxID=1198456 RepID=A0A1H0WPZ8_9GAMM|nr:alpha/beta hydrolase [Pseudomonas guguanensis]SDP92743.1 Pimeloyl-ACP methyl ester carboxylesterase [Pseudomonas guguanensis]